MDAVERDLAPARPRAMRQVLTPQLQQAIWSFPKRRSGFRRR